MLHHSTVHSSQFAIRNSQFAIRNSQFAILLCLLMQVIPFELVAKNNFNFLTNTSISKNVGEEAFAIKVNNNLNNDVLFFDAAAKTIRFAINNDMVSSNPASSTYINNLAFPISSTINISTAPNSTLQLLVGDFITDANNLSDIIVLENNNTTAQSILHIYKNTSGAYTLLSLVNTMIVGNFKLYPWDNTTTTQKDFLLYNAANGDLITVSLSAAGVD